MAPPRWPGRSTRRSFPVEITYLPTVRCQLCKTKLPHRPGDASDVLTRHYEQHHTAAPPDQR